AAVVEDGVAAVGVADRGELGGHLVDRGVPVDLLEGAVRPAPERTGEAMAPVLVVVEAQCLFAGVALRRGVVLVASDPHEAPVLHLYLDAAVHRAEDAGRLVPVIDLVTD